MCPDCQPPKRISRGQLIVALANAGPAALESKAWAARWRSKAGLPSAKLATDLHEWIHQFGTRPVLRVEWARKFPSKSVEASERGWERLKVRLREFGVPHELGFEWVSHRSGGDAHQVRTIKLTDPDWVRIVLAAVCPTDSKVWVIPKDVKSWR